MLIHAIHTVYIITLAQSNEYHIVHNAEMAPHTQHACPLVGGQHQLHVGYNGLIAFTMKYIWLILEGGMEGNSYRM